MKQHKIVKPIVTTLSIVILLLLIVWFVNKPQPIVLQGRIEAKEIYLSSKIPSRLLSTEVSEGESVVKGQLLATLESPEILAKEVQAIAAKDAAKAQMLKAQNGARAEEISAYKNVYEKAKVAADVMVKTYTRIENLYADGVVSAQKRDEAYAKKEAALNDKEAAYNQYKIALKGARNEDISAANAMVKKAEGAISELESYKTERFITSPINAEVLDFLPEEGELIGAGYPIAHLVDLTNSYAIINIKETDLSHFKKGNVFVANVPALNNKEIKFKIYYIAPLGDYATWNATKTTGDFDVRTFEIKAKPIDKENELRPGMSVLIGFSQFEN